MTAALRRPTFKDICDLFGGLLGRQVTAASGARVAITFDEPGMVAVYVDDNLAMFAVALFDVPLAAACGAALGLLPPRVVETCLVANALTDAIADNVAEIMNVMTGIVSGPQSPELRLPHLRLHKVYRTEELLPFDVATLASTLGRRVDVELTVAGYGGGQLSIVYE
jgi:hypothetical protein